MHPIVISIEGNIGSGKSTLMEIFKQKFPQLELTHASEIFYLDEPVEDWKNINQNQDLNILQTFYEDPCRWAYSFQIYALFTRLK